MSGEQQEAANKQYFAFINNDPSVIDSVLYLDLSDTDDNKRLFISELINIISKKDGVYNLFNFKKIESLQWSMERNKETLDKYVDLLNERIINHDFNKKYYMYVPYILIKTGDNLVLIDNNYEKTSESPKKIVMASENSNNKITNIYYNVSEYIMIMENNKLKKNKTK